MRLLQIIFSFSIFLLTLGQLKAQDSLRIIAPSAYPCIGNTSFIPLGDIVIEELSAVNTAIPNTSGSTDSIIFRITNSNRFEFEVPDNATTVHSGSLTLADTRTYTWGALGDTLVFRYRLTGSTNGGVDRFTIQGVRVRAKGTVPGVAEIVRVGGNSAWPDIQVANNITFATLISVTSANQSINAGLDQTKCFPESFSLSGSLNLTYPYADTVLWFTTNGAGSFSSTSSRNTVYTPAPADTSLAGPIQIRFRLDNNNCFTTLQDTLFLTLSKRIQVEAGPADTVCANGPFQLNGSIVQGVATASGVWSGGAGTFLPNNSTLNATYTPSAAEISGSGFFLTLSSTVAACQSVRDSVRLVSNPKNRPSINAGTDFSVCRGSTVSLSAIVSNLGSATLSWSKVPGAPAGSFSATTIVNPVYTPSNADYDSGSVRLVLSSVGGTCGIVTDTIQINFQALPIASLVCLDADTTICAGQPISFQAFGGASYRFLVNNTLQGASATATNSFTSTSLANGDTIRARVFSGASGAGCVNATNFFRVRVNPIPATPTWTATTQNFANNAPPIELDSIGTRTLAGGTYSGTGVIGNFLFPSQVAPATSTSITYSVIVNGCPSNPSAPVTFNFFDPNQPIAGLAAAYCFNEPQDTIFADIPPGRIFFDFGFFNGAVFVPFPPADILVTASNVRAIILPSTLGSVANGGIGTKRVVLRTYSFSPVFNIQESAVQNTRINANPVITITNALTGIICEGTRQDSIQVSVTPNNPGSFSFSNAVTPIAGGGARYNTQDNGVLPLWPSTRTASIVFTESGTGCSGATSNSFSVTRQPNQPILPADDTLLCAGVPLPTFNAIIDTTGISSFITRIFWFNESNSTTNGIIASNTSIYPPSGSGTQTFQVTDTLYVRQRILSDCFSDPASIIVRISNPPIPNAGIADTVCEGQPIPIDGIVSNAPVGLTTSWSTATPNPGSFTNTTLLTGVTYTPSLADRNRGFVRVQLTTSDPDGPGGCPEQEAEVRHIINKVASLFAGNDTVICAGSPMTLRPAITPTTLGGRWFPQDTLGIFTSGATVPTQQNFTPSNGFLSPTDSTRVRMIFRTDDPDNAGPCTAIEDTMFIRVNPRNILNAGRDSVYCESADTITNIDIRSTIGVTFSGNPLTPLIWSANGNHNGFVNASNLPDSLYRLDNSRARTYRASAADVQRGFVWLVLTALDPDGGEPCTPVSDSIRIQINRRPRVNAGVDQTICSNGAVPLNAILSSNVAGAWTLGAGTFSRQGPLVNKRLYTDALYTPALSEISATAITTVLLRWQTNDTDSTGPCPIIEDDILITINPKATIQVGNTSDTICAGQTFTFAAAIGGGASSSTWIGGQGTFNPSRSSPTATYTPDSTEIPLVTNFRNITFSLATNDPDSAGPCQAETLNKRLVLNRIPTVRADSASRDTIIICSNETASLKSVLGGSASVATWIGGTGTFSNRNITAVLNSVTYAPNLNDPNEYTPNQPRFITLILESNSFDQCAPVKDTVIIRVNPIPIVNAGPDLVICAGDSTQLGGSFSGSTTAVVWKGGLGTFVPNRNAANAWYIPHPSEIPLATPNFTITLRLFSDDPDGFDPVAGPCDSVFDVKTLTINRIRTVVADTSGRDTIVYCRGAEYRLAAGFSVPGTTVTWSGGTGTFSPTANRFTTYLPGPGELDSTSTVFVRLRVTTDDPDSINQTLNGPCGRVFDEVILRIDPAVVINAGPDLTYCASQTVQLFGAIGGSATSAIWSGGTNNFNNLNALNAVYFPDSAQLFQDTVFNLILFSATQAGSSCPSKADTVQISLYANPVLNISLPDTQFCNLPIPITGQLNASIIGKPSLPSSIASVSGPGITNFTSVNFTFNPTVAGDSLKIITYAFTRLATEGDCFSDTTLNIVVHPQPRAALKWSGTCQGDTLLFSDSSRLDISRQFSPNSIVTWAWDFDLGSIAQDSIGGIPSDSSYLQNPSYFYRTPGLKRPSLTVTTNNNCTSRADSIFAIGARTKPDFFWRFVCPADSTFYSDSLSVTAGAGNVTFRRWVFGTGTVIQGSSSSLNTIRHQYPGPGAYTTRLVLGTQFGCLDSISRTVNILASTSPTPLAPYVQDFDSNNGFWVSGGVNNDWGYGQTTNPNKDFVPKYPTDRYWMTSLNDTIYNNNQASFVNGPCVNFENLEKPMLVFDYKNETTIGQDGAVIQYSIDGGINWLLLGSLNSGINWYNRRDLSGNPGGQLIGNFGWNDTTPDLWKTARHSLDVIKELSDPDLQKKVRFRIFFGSDAASLPTKAEGFAIDNFRIEDRTRLVLLEYFNNVNVAFSATNNSVYASIIQEMEKDAVGTAYYLSGNNDPINQRNPADPSARALFYGISSPNEVVFNGKGVFPLALRDSVGPKRIELQSLLPPKLKLDVVGFSANQVTSTVGIKLEAKDSIPPNARLHVGLVESVVYVPAFDNPSQLRAYSWVLRKMLPNAAGTLLNPSFNSIGDTLYYSFTDTLEDGLVNDLSRLGVVAFVQNSQTKEVEQAAIFRSANWNIVGLPDGLIDATELGIFPNPANEKLTLRFSEPIQKPMHYTLVDLMGKTMLEGVLQADTQETELRTEELKSGMYIFRLYSPDSPEQELITKKIIIQH